MPLGPSKMDQNKIRRVPQFFLFSKCSNNFHFNHQNFFSRKIEKLLTMCTKGRQVSITMTKDFVLSLCKTIKVFVIVLSCSYTFPGFPLKLTWMHISCASLSAHNRVPIYKPTQRKGVYKCIRVRTAPQPCCKGGNVLREYHDVQRTHRNTPGGPFQCCPDCSATPRGFDGLGCSDHRTEA